MSVDQTEETQWCNADNADIYHNMPIRYLKSLAKKIGLDDHCDLKQIAPYIERSRRVLEIGCGYGRVIEGLQKINPALDITVVEREPKFVEHVQTEYPNVHCIAEDILTAELKGSYDLVLMMWSTVSEFSHSEIEKLMELLKGARNESSVIIFEHGILNGEHPFCDLAVDNIIIKLKFGTLRALSPLLCNFKKLSKKMHSVNKVVDFFTENGCPRRLNIFLAP